MKKEIKKSFNSNQKKIYLILFGIHFILTIIILPFFFSATVWHNKVLSIILLLLFALGSLSFLALYFFKDNKFFRFVLLVLITPMIFILSTLIILMYTILIPVICLVLMMLLAFCIWAMLGFSLLHFGIDGSNEALFYIATLASILTYYYFGEKMHKALNSFTYWLAANTFSRELRSKIERYITPQSSRKLLYILLFFIYVIVKVADFSGTERVFGLNFVNEALLTFVIWDSLVGGRNVITFRK